MDYNACVHMDDGSTELAVDATLYCPDAVLQTAYLFTGECYVTIAAADQRSILIRFAPKKPSVEMESLVREFLNELIDQQLRTRIRSETADIQRAIVSEAFAPLDTKED
jgi:His-Xaa-Ser system protein HxsD